MIGMITGQVVHLSAPTATIMTTGGVGYEIELPVADFCTLQHGNQATLFTHLVVREDAQLLFGFDQHNKREIFRKLIKINGVGAKMALAILSTLGIDELCQAISHDDDKALTRVAGIGKKTAQRLIIELKGKLDNATPPLFFETTPSPESPAQTNPMHVIAEVESALVSLGYKEKEAQNAIKSARQILGDDVQTASLLKASLKQLSGF